MHGRVWSRQCEWSLCWLPMLVACASGQSLSLSLSLPLSLFPFGPFLLSLARQFSLSFPMSSLLLTLLCFPSACQYVLKILMRLKSDLSQLSFLIVDACSLGTPLTPIDSPCPQIRFSIRDGAGPFAYITFGTNSPACWCLQLACLEDF